MKNGLDQTRCSLKRLEREKQLYIEFRIPVVAPLILNFSYIDFHVHYPTLYNPSTNSDPHFPL